MKLRTDLSPVAYHQLYFNPKNLPDVAAAGPVSASLLARARKPIHLLTKPDKAQTQDMAWGSLVDCMWLTPDKFNESFGMLPPDPPKDLRRFRDAAKKSPETLASIAFWDEWDAKMIGKTGITQAELDVCIEAVNALNAHPIAREIREASDTQIVLQGPCFLPDPAGYSGMQVQAKMMLDLLPRSGQFQNAVVDLKTCHDISDYGIKQAIKNFEYHLKMAFYHHGLQVAESRSRDKVMLIFQESSFPFRVRVVELNEMDIVRGHHLAEARYHSLFKMDHRKLDVFIDKEIKKISMDEWMVNDDQAQLTRLSRGQW